LRTTSQDQDDAGDQQWSRTAATRSSTLSAAI
jgi:hypothetical protein